MEEAASAPSWQELLARGTELGLGLAYLTRDAAQRLYADVAERGRAKRARGQEVLGELRDKGREHKAKLEAQVSQVVERVLARANLARAGDLRALEERVRHLEEKPGG